MSKQIDERVVEMRFDNKNFESNVQTSLSTLDKLKRALKLDGASKGLEDVSATAKKVDMSGLGGAVQTVTTRFSALQVMGVTALANITNSAINAGKNMVSALTIDPIKTGFSEYELKMGSIRTIMSSTGESLETVNKYLMELNEYSDKTIYSFSDMTQNIGKFTNAGVKLEDAVLAIKGISNEAALAGANSNEASRAMYNFAQALSAGHVKLMDWKSIELANMATVDFKEQLLASAVAAGTLKKSADGMYITLSGTTLNATQNFNESLNDQWMTTEVLVGTLKDYADETTEIGKKATKAATEIESFSKLLDTLKESAQSGWATTWELIFGDYYEGINLWTGINNVVGGLLDKMSDVRNNLLEGAMGMGFGKLSKTIKTVLGPIDKVVDGTKKVGNTVDKVTESVKDLDSIVEDVILEKFGTGKERYDKLTKAGYNYYKVQNKVNEKLGDSRRHSKEQIEAQDKLLKSQEKTVEQTEKTEVSIKNLDKTQKNELKRLASMTEEQARANGCTEEQIKALKELNEVAKKLGMPLGELIDNLDEINGRWILLNSFKNIGESLGKILSAVGTAFKDVFSAIKPSHVFDAITAFHRFTEALVISDETADKITRTFRGVFAAVEIVSRIVGGGLRIAMTVISAVLKAFGMTTLDLTANIGDLIYKFNEWLEEHDYLKKAIEWLAEKILPIVEKVKEFAKALWVDSGAADNFQRIAAGLESIRNVLKGKFVPSLNNGLKIFNTVLSLFGTSLGDIIAKLADWIVIVVKWIDENTLWMNGVTKISEIIKTVIVGIVDLAKAFWNLEPVQKMIEKIKDAFANLKEIFNFDFSFDGDGLERLHKRITNVFKNIKEWINSLGKSETFQAGLNVVKGLAEGIASGAENVLESISDIAKKLIDKFCEILGIHSPSTVMIAIGGFIIAGLIYGLLTNASGVLDVIKSVADTIVTTMADVFQNGLPFIVNVVKTIGTKLFGVFQEWDFDIGQLIVVGTIIGVIVMFKKLIGILDKAVSPISKVGNSISGVLDAVADRLEGPKGVQKFKIVAESIKAIAIAIGILAASFYLLSKLEWGEIAKGAVAIGIVSGALLLLAMAANKMETVEFGKMAAFLLAFSTSVLILSGAMKIMASIDAEGAKTAIWLLTSVVLGMGTILAIFGTFIKNEGAAKSANKVAKLFTRMGVAMLIIAAAVKIMAGIPEGDIHKGLTIIGYVSVIFAAFVALSKISFNADQAGSMMLKMALALGVVALVIKVIAGIPNDDLQKGMFVIACIEALFLAVVAVSKLAGAHASKAGSMLLKMSIAVGILAGTMKLFATMSYDEIKQGLLCIAGIELLFAAFILVSKLCGNEGNKAGSMIFKMAAGMALMALAIKLIATIPNEDIVKGLAVIAAIEVLFGAMVVVSQLGGPYADKAGTMMLKMSAAILILVAAIALISLLDPKDVAVGTAAIVAMLGMFALIMKMSQYVQSSMPTLIVMTVAIGIIAGTLITLSCLDPGKVIPAALAISAVLGVFALVLKASSNINSSLGTLIVMTVAVGLLSGMLYVLAKCPTDGVIASAIAISAILISLSISFAIIKGISANVVSAIPALVAMTVAVGLLAGMLALLTKFNLQPSIESATALSILLLAMSAACLILAQVGKTGYMALLGAAILDGVILVIGGLVVGIGAAMSKWEGLEGHIDKGLEVLQKLGYGLGKALGNIVGGALDGMASGLPGVADNLSSFMKKLGPFLDGVKGMDESTMNGVKSLAQTVLILTGADLLNSLTSWFTGGNSLTQFADQLVPFGKGMKAYANEVSGIDAAAVSSSAQAAKGLAQVAKAIPTSGGLWDLIAGDKNLADFGMKLVPFGRSMRLYAIAVSGIDTAAIIASADAAKAIAKVSNAIPASGGLWDLIAGSNDLDTFGVQIVTFGHCMKKYAKKVSGIDTAAIVASADAAKAVASVSKAIPASGGLWDLISGSNDLDTFGTQLVSLGEKIKSYSEKVSGMDVGAIDSSVYAAKKLVRFLKGLEGFTTDGISAFNSAMTKLGRTNVDSFIKAFKNASSDLSSIGAQMVSDVVKGAKNKKSSFNSVGESLVTSLNKGINSKKSLVKDACAKVVSAAKTGILNKKKDFKTAGENLSKALAEGIKAKKTTVENAAKSVVKAAKNEAGSETYKKQFETVGKNLAKGIRDGLDDSGVLESIKKKARKLVKAAKKAAEEEGEIKSPSRVFYRIGGFMASGLANALGDNARTAFKASATMAKGAINGFNSAIANLSDLVDADMDVNPTIRPVLDLSDVRSGAGAISDIIGGQKLAIDTGLVGSISASMNSRQNGSGNGDVISAIKDLGRTLSGRTGDTYNINGITYDDGSNVVNAVNTLIRAANMERRA